MNGILGERVSYIWNILHGVRKVFCTAFIDTICSWFHIQSYNLSMQLWYFFKWSNYIIEVVLPCETLHEVKNTFLHGLVTCGLIERKGYNLKFPSRILQFSPTSNKSIQDGYYSLVCVLLNFYQEEVPPLNHGCGVGPCLPLVEALHRGIILAKASWFLQLSYQCEKNFKPFFLVQTYIVTQ